MLDVVQAVLAALFLTSGAAKWRDRAGLIGAMNVLRLPEKLKSAAAQGLPAFEVVLGVLLLTDVAVNAAAAVSGLLLLAFACVLTYARWHRLAIDCGCFGSSQPAQVSRVPIARNALFAIGALAVALLSDGAFVPATEPVVWPLLLASATGNIAVSRFVEMRASYSGTL